MYEEQDNAKTEEIARTDGFSLLADPELTRRFSDAVIRYLEARSAQGSEAEEPAEVPEEESAETDIDQSIKSVRAYMDFLNSMSEYYVEITWRAASQPTN